MHNATDHVATSLVGYYYY